MTRGEGIAATWGGTLVSYLTLTINPVLSALASLFAIELSCVLIYKAVLEIKHRKKNP
jgi:hypothetical protein